ncbi:ribonuclease P protein component [Patescibacteria group bacterium]|nr:ribonuclease P protein component [Patescibacteria group bacterium]
MFKKEPTLKRAIDFSKVYRCGRKWVGDNLIIYCFFTNSQQVRRLAVVVSKKVSTKAVVRNLCRRRILGAFRKTEAPALGYDLVLVAKKSAADQKENVFKQELVGYFFNNSKD